MPSLAYSSGPVYPKGWRAPAADELVHVMRSNKNNRDTLASGDFTGNGLVDGAAILVRKDKKEIALFLFTYDNAYKKEKWRKLDSQKYSKMISLGIGTYPPGKYKVLCTGSDECDKNGKKEIEISTTSIKYFQYEASSSLFIWDQKKKTFNRVWETN